MLSFLQGSADLRYGLAVGKSNSGTSPESTQTPSHTFLQQLCAMQETRRQTEIQHTLSHLLFNISASLLSPAWRGLISCFWHLCDTQASGGIRLTKRSLVQVGLRMERKVRRDLGGGESQSEQRKRLRKVLTKETIFCSVWKAGR